MKLLGIDYGKKRIGLATSDMDGRLAFPHSIVSNDNNALSTIIDICTKENVNKIIIGESKNYEMQDNDIMEQARTFSENLKKMSGINAEFHPEFMSSMQISKEMHHAQTPREQKVRGENEGEIDARAATIILQSYIDSNK